MKVAQHKRLIFPKPYLPGHNGDGVSLLDKRRVFAVALAYAEPYDNVDLMICRQSL